MTHANPCICGRPIPDTANLCPDCVGTLRRNLYKIADRWAELEEALSWRQIIPGAIGFTDDGQADREAGERRLALVSGTSINEAAVRARRAATDLVWFVVQVVRDDYDEHGWTFRPHPVMRANRTQDQTPTIARWLASSHVEHLARRADRDTAEEIARDTEAAEGLVYRATHPSGVHWAPVNLVCDSFGTTDLGERVPCTGSMWALVGTGSMPELVCDVDEQHTVAPIEWERAGWKRRLRQPLNESGMARLAARLNG